MTTFVDGPAQGQTLMLRRAPQFLRVTQEGRKFDALDQLNDTPKPEEKLFAYVMVGQPGHVHINTGRKPGGGFYPIATYRFAALRPADIQMRSIESWCAWVHAQVNLEAPVEL